MKKHLLGLILCLISFFPLCYAGGGITHMFLAREAITKLPDPALRNLLLDNIDAYLVGAYYPDSGYIKGNLYGEDSHWDPFIYAFADYLKEKYIDPVSQNPKLVAFLFGCAAHRVSDEIMHWTFYPIIKGKDFDGDADQAHSYGDTGIDLLLNVDKNQWFTQPSTWWVPVKDLVEIYHRMGKDNYTAQQIIWGNTVLIFAGYGERMISTPAYPILKWKMPWTATHYYDWPIGGIVPDEVSVAKYQTKLWQRLYSKSKTHSATAKMAHPNAHYDASNPVTNLAQTAIESGAVTVKTKTNADGSIEFQPPVINQLQKLQSLINQFLTKLMR